MRRRIIISLGLLLALCVIGDVIALVSLNTSIAELSALAESQRIQVMRANLASSAVRIETDLLAYSAGRPRDTIRRNDSARRFESSLQQCGGCHHRPPVQSRLNALRATFGEYTQAVDRLVSAAPGEDARLREREATVLVDRLTRQATEMADQAQDHMAADGRDAAASIQKAWLALIGTMIAALVLGGVIAFHLQRRLTRPVETLLHGIRRMQGGDARHRFRVEGDQEFRALAGALNEAYRRMATAQEGALQAEKMAAVGRLAAGVAHEVGNPLASISAVAQMMRRGAADPKERERCELIMQHVARVSEVVRELLTFARPSQDDGWQRVNVSELLDESVGLLQYDKRAQRASFESTYDSELFIERGNPDRLLLVFTNVMINALDAIGARRNGDGRVRIDAERDGEALELRFSDDGIGMTAAELESAFEPFFTTKAPGTGTGLGLWVCYQVVQKHRGAIRIESEPRVGTTVSIRLPTIAGEGRSRQDAPEPA